VPSPAYQRIAEAMRNRKPMACVYDGRVRVFCPIVLGHSQGQEKALVYQFAGSTSKGPLTAPEWKCFFVSKMHAIEIRDGTWRSGDRHRKPQSCVEIVDLDVNPLSPYSPARKIDK
jgi:hypothetical protein